MNRYDKTLAYLFSLQRVGIKLGLDNITTLLDALGNPEKAWPAIHIAGTNGKGTTSAILESVLLQAGYKVGLYTSPHLVNFTERMRVNRRQIPVSEIVRLTDQLRSLIEKIQPSFFEVTTAIAFWHFAAEEVDIAITEVGMGGRLDSTNVVQPLISLITPIGFDHQHYLGTSLEEIAAEKGGIIKQGVPCLTNNRDIRVLEVLANICKKNNSTIENIYDNSSYRIHSTELEGSRFDITLAGNTYSDLFINLAGDYQIDNVLLAINALNRLSDKIEVHPNHIRNGVKDVLWKGRLERVSSSPAVVVDVSHNPHGVDRTLRFLLQHYHRNQIETITFLQRDKDYREIGKYLAHASRRVHVVDLQKGTPADPGAIHASVLEHGGEAWVWPGFDAAIESALSSLTEGDLLLIIGSHYLAGAAYEYLDRKNLAAHSQNGIG